MQQCALPPKLDMGKPTAGDCNRTHWEKASWNVAPWSLRFLAAEVKPAQKAASLGWRRDAAAFRSLCDFSNGYFVRAPGNWSCIPRPTASLRLWKDGIRLLTIEEGLKYQDVGTVPRSSNQRGSGLVCMYCSLEVAITRH